MKNRNGRWGGAGTSHNRVARGRNARARLLCEALELRCLLSTFTWIGTNPANVNWSNDANWNPAGPITTGSTLSFASPSATELATNNDELAGNNYNLAFTEPNYNLNGNQVDISGPTALDASSTTGFDAINLPLDVTANATATFAGDSVLVINVPSRAQAASR